MSGIDYESWKELREYRNYLDIHTVPNPDRKRWQLWKPLRIANPNLRYTDFEFPDIEVIIRNEGKR